MHVDGDAFFASCEVARDPKLRGKPVVVGGLRGIAVALTYEAKALGVTRGMPVFQINKMYPQVVVLPGNYDLYEQFAVRMYAIVRRYTPYVEEYSVDECFAELTRGDYEDTARLIKQTLEAELGVSFSVGLATTKVLAKVASKHNKPSGLVCIPAGEEQKYLEDLACGKVWGIGPATAEKLQRQKIMTAWQLVNQPAWWVKETLGKNHRALVAELKGVAVYDVHSEGEDDQKSIQSTRTFRPSTTEKSKVLSELSKNIEEACRHARAASLKGKHVYCFLKSQDFQYLRFELSLPAHTNTPSDILSGITPLFNKFFVPGIQYRATGMTLADMRPAAVEQQDLFGAHGRAEAERAVYGVVDALGHKYGKGAVHLAGSMQALKGATARPPRLPLPFLGDVC